MQWKLLGMGTLLLGLAAPAAHAAEAVIGSVTELEELRVQTDRTREVDGREQAVYDLRKPGKGMTFVNFRLYVSGSGKPFTVRADDLAVRDSKDPDGLYRPFDWFQEDGLVERRGDSVTIQDAGILNATVEVPASGWRQLTIRFQGQDVGSLGGKESTQENTQPLTSSISRGKTPKPAVPVTTGEATSLFVNVAQAERLTELRVNTDRTRTVDGDEQVVYELKKPGAGMTFLNFRIEVAADGDPARFTAEDLRLVVPGSDAGPFVPFDWFREDGLKQTRGASVTLTSGILEFTIEMPRDVERTARLMVKDQDLGRVADLLP